MVFYVVLIFPSFGVKKHAHSADKKNIHKNKENKKYALFPMS